MSILGLQEPRPDLKPLAYMLCRHNQLVQDWGKIRDKQVIMQRERQWNTFVTELEAKYHKHAGDIPASEFYPESGKFRSAIA